MFAVAALVLALNGVGEMIAGLTGALSLGVLMQLLLPDLFALAAVLWAVQLTSDRALPPLDGR